MMMLDRPMPATQSNPLRSGPPIGDTVRTRSYAAVVERAEALIRARPDAPWSGASLARAAGVSRRSMERSFKQVRGCGPLEAVRRVRLGYARRDLLTARAESSVTETAMRWGFLHLGRFSRAYAGFFGERPSETLRRSRAVTLGAQFSPYQRPESEW